MIRMLLQDLRTYNSIQYKAIEFKYIFYLFPIIYIFYLSRIFQHRQLIYKSKNQITDIILAMSNIEEAIKFKNAGNEAFKAQNYESAIQNFTKAIELNPNDQTYYSNRSNAYLNLKNYEKALEDAQLCIKTNSQWPRGYQRKGTALFYLDKIDQAIQAYEEGLKIDPNNAALQQDLKSAKAKKSGPGQNPMMNQAYLQGLMKLINHPQTKDFIQDQAFMQKLQIIMQQPQLLPMMMEQDPRLKKAFDVISSQMSNEFDFESMMKNMSQGQSKAQSKTQTKPEKPAGAPPKQQTKHEKMQEQNPAENYKTQGNEEFKKKNFQKALELYDQAIKLKPQQPLYYNNKAAAFIEMGQLQKAMQEIQKVEKLFDEGIVKDFVKKAKVYARKASILSKKTDYDEAIKFYEKSLMEDHNQKVKDQLTKVRKIKKEKQDEAYINPQLAQVACENGNTLFKEGKFPQALKQYEQAIKRNPSVAKYYSNLGTVYVKLMEFGRARQYFDLALQKDPTYVKVYPKKGDCYFFMKQYHKALQAYEQGLKHDPQNALCKQGLEKTRAVIYTGGGSQQQQEQRARRAMADPEIQQILNTPEIRNVLAELQTNPAAAMNALQNPNIASKLQKLIEAGILRTG